MTTRLTVSLAVLGALVAGALPAHAQIRASERGGVSQTVDGTTIAIDYSRPQARGRKLFGGEVAWGRVWTGANWATTIEVNKDVTIDGHQLAKGKYSMWFEVQPEAWTAIFDPEPRRFHVFPPETADDQLRFSVHPSDGPHQDVLTWSFPTVRPTGTTLQFAWGTKTVQFDVGVPSSRVVTVPASFGPRYNGAYRLALQGPLGTDTVAFDVRYEQDRLVATWENAPNPRLQEFWLIHLGQGMFIPGELEQGELFDMLTDVVLEFTPLEGRANRFELRALGDQLWGVATRVR